MLSVDSLAGLLSRKGPLFLAAGFFDGVHLGHARIFAAAADAAHRAGGEAWALTFDRHPRSVISPASAPPIVTPLPLRLDLIAATGVDGACVLRFDEALAGTSPEDFARELFARRNVAEVHCGADWRFGRGAAGTPDLMDAAACLFGARVVAAAPVLYDGAPVSSSRIRAAIQAGDLDGARAMLGRPHFVRAEVVRGRGEASRLGLPTANLDTGEALLPPIGVYAVKARMADGGDIRGVGGVSMRPTFPGARPERPVLEVHLIGFDGDIYGKTLDVSFIRKIRDEARFPSGEALFARIRRDIEEACAILDAEGRI